MAAILNSLRGFQGRIGWQPMLFFTLAFVALAFARGIPGDGSNSDLNRFVTFVACSLFGLALLTAVLRVTSTYFRHRPARGLIDGLAAGLIAGLVGGALGYASHTGHFMGLPYEASYADDPVARRMAVCVLFTVPVAGLLGVLLDLVHPTRRIAWAKYAGAIVLAVALVVCLTGFGIYAFATDSDGPGITVSDVQLLFEVFLLTISAIMAVSFRWPLRKFLARLPLLALAVAAARVPTFVLHSSDPAQAGVPLYLRRFLREYETSLADRISGANADWAVQLAFVVIMLMAWTVAAYVLFYKDHRLSRWLDGTGGAARSAPASRPAPRPRTRRPANAEPTAVAG